MRSLLTAFGFLTIAPVPLTREPAAADLAWAAAWFPVVGLTIGLALAGLDWAARALWDPHVAAALVVGAALLATGGLHVDGLADSADAFFSHRDRAGLLAVMSDARIGALGAAALVSLLLCKFAAFASLQGPHHWRVIAAAPALGRAAMALVVPCFPYVRAGGLGAGFATGMGFRHAFAAVALALSAAYLLLQLPGLAVAAAAFSAAFLCAAYWAHRLGGLTGDIYGAVNEFTELAALLAGAIALSR